LGEAEVDIEVAGDRHSRIAVALSTDFRSECHLDDFFAAIHFGSFSTVSANSGRSTGPKAVIEKRTFVDIMLNIGSAYNLRL